MGFDGFITLADGTSIGRIDVVRNPIRRKPSKTFLKRKLRILKTLHLDSIYSRSPNPQIKICQVRDLPSTKQEKYLGQILELTRENTFDPYTQTAPSDEQKRNGFLSEAFAATELKLQQTYITAFIRAISHSKTEPFFVALDETKDQIIGIMPTPNCHGKLKRILTQHQLTLPIVDLVNQMLKVLPGANQVNTWYTGGICVDKNYRGQGLARRLFENLITWLRSKETRYLIVSHDNENFASARFCKNFNNIPMSSEFEGFNMVNRPYTIKVLDLNHEPLFKHVS